MPPKRSALRAGKSTTNPDGKAQQQSTSEASEPPTAVEATESDVKNDTSEPLTPLATPSVAQQLKHTEPTSASPSSVRGRGSGRPVARPRGIGRRSHKDRAELEKAEQERRQAEAASKARETAWKQRRDLARSRGALRGRMRGGYAGEGERRKDSSGPAIGPFSAGEVSKTKGTRTAPSGTSTGRSAGGGGGSSGGARAGGSSSTSGGQSVKQEFGPAPTRTYINPEDGGYISSGDEYEPDTKLNVDNLIDLTLEDEDRGLPPVRVVRFEHRGRDLVSTNTESMKVTHNTGTAADVERKRGKQRAKDVEITKESHHYKGTYTDSESDGEHQVKPEPVEDDARPLAMDTMHSPPTSPDTRRKAKDRIKHGSNDSHVPRPAFQTKEEELEWDIHQRDLRILRGELGPAQLSPDAMEDAGNPAEDPRADKVYLFQLPAVLPTLVPLVPKAEEEDVVMQDVPEVGTAATDSKVAKPPILNGSTGASGLVGKLRVHASGKAFLDWGGIPMEVSMGQEATFLQDVLVLDSRDTKPVVSVKDAEDDIAGMALSMGQVKGKFVVVPEWDKIFDEIA